MADVWINGVEVKYAEISRASVEKAMPRSCYLWPPERLCELEQAIRWRPVAENEARAQRGQ